MPNAKPRKPSGDVIVAKLLKELPELLADYEHVAPDFDGKLDPIRKRTIARIGRLLLKHQTSQS